MSGFTFSQALVAIKIGKKVARTGWNGADQYVTMQRPDEHSKMTLPYAYLYNAQGQCVPWVPSQGDLFAADWQLV